MLEFNFRVSRSGGANRLFAAPLPAEFSRFPGIVLEDLSLKLWLVPVLSYKIGRMHLPDTYCDVRDGPKVTMPLEFQICADGVLAKVMSTFFSKGAIGPHEC